MKYEIRKKIPASTFLSYVLPSLALTAIAKERSAIKNNGLNKKLANLFDGL
jgi:hypothetical protein